MKRPAEGFAVRHRGLRADLAIVLVGAMLIATACSAGNGPTWTYSPPGSQAAAASTSTASPSPSPTATSSPTPAPIPSVAPTATPAPTPSGTPRPPDPGEPGFVAGTKAKPRVIAIATNDLLLFDPTVVTVQQGETITFRITNKGKATHEFKVGPMAAAFGDLASAPEVAGITPGSTKSLTYTFSGTGPYAYACHEPGHYENGMIGFVNVIPTTAYLGTPSHPRMIVIAADDHLEFVPAEVSVTPSETILFVIPNVGTDLTHEFQIGPADRVALDQVDGQIVKEADQILPGHVAYLTYTFGASGSYAYACHEPGHYEAGMKGVIDLTP
jgi:uncharacterized cupredoxin-like copper-binding protein